MRREKIEKRRKEKGKMKERRGRRERRGRILYCTTLQEFQYRSILPAYLAAYPSWLSIPPNILLIVITSFLPTRLPFSATGN